MKPSLLGWSGVRQLRRVSLGSSQDRSVAIAVQRGSAMAYLEGHYGALTVLGRPSEEEEEEEAEGEDVGQGERGKEDEGVV